MLKFVIAAKFVTALTLIFLSFGGFAANAVVGTGTPASCTETTFNAALALVVNDNQGGVLTFNCGPDPDIILLSSVKNLVNFVEIDGGGKMTLSGGDTTRLFNINQDGVDGRTEVTIRNITLTRGNSGAQPFGGLVLVNANTLLNVDNVSMTDSLASTSGGAIAAAPNTTLNVNNSRFINNLSANGGAIATSAVTTVTGSVFRNNNASGGEGGAIQSYAQNLSVTASQFGGNGARAGGAIYKRDAQLSVEDSNLSTNTSSQNGGAIFLLSSVTAASIQRSYLRENAATGQGGAIFAEKQLFVFRSTLSGNTASSGGAIRINRGDLWVEASALNDNSAILDGGAISVAQSVTSFEDTLLRYLSTSNNQVTSPSGVGGDISINSSTPLRAFILNSSLIGASSSTNRSTLSVVGGSAGQIEFSLRGNLTWASNGIACFYANTSVTSLGGNIGAPSCASNSIVLLNLADFGLGEFAGYGGGHNTFLPQSGSVAIDSNLDACFLNDARLKPSPIDGDGMGGAQCDSGAVERQLVETPAALFRNGFE